MTTITETPRSTIWRGYSGEGATTWADSTGVFEGAIPLEKVRDELFGWEAKEGDVSINVLDESGVSTYQAPEFKGIVNPSNGRVMGIHSQSYGLHQFPEWLLVKVGNILDDDLTIAGAGTFAWGAVAFVQIEMPETSEVHGVKFRTFLNAATSHNGSISSTYTPGNTLIICSNMMGSAFAGGFKVRHTANSLGRISNLREALGILQGEKESFATEVDKRLNTTVTEAQWQEFVDTYTGLNRPHLSARSRAISDRKARELHAMWGSSPMVEPFRGTAFGVLQVVSTARHHLSTVRGATRAERNMLSMVTGTNAAADNKVLTLLDRVLANA